MNKIVKMSIGCIIVFAIMTFNLLMTNPKESIFVNFSIQNLIAINYAFAEYPYPPGVESEYRMEYIGECYICVPYSMVCNVPRQCCISWGNCPK